MKVNSKAWAHSLAREVRALRDGNKEAADRELYLREEEGPPPLKEEQEISKSVLHRIVEGLNKLLSSAD